MTLEFDSTMMDSHEQIPDDSPSQGLMLTHTPSDVLDSKFSFTKNNDSDVAKRQKMKLKSLNPKTTHVEKHTASHNNLHKGNSREKRKWPDPMRMVVMIR